ncbi:MAG: PD-(D/E)XK nuclease family protein [Acidimicrobiales bacterium]
MKSEPVAPSDLVDRIRGLGLERPQADEALAGRVRAQLEEAAGSAGVDPLTDASVRVNKSSLRDVLICESRLVAFRARGSSRPSANLLAGKVMDLVFALVAVGERLPADPLATVSRLARVAGEQTLAAELDALSPGERQEVADIVTACSSSLADRWPLLPDSAMMRLQEPLRVELAGGLVVLSGRVDLVVGRPAADRAGATLVDVKSGHRRHDDTLDAGWYALLETLRHRAAPFQVGTYYLRDGVLDLAVVDEELIGRAAARVGDGIARLARLGAGSIADVTPNGLCPWCPALDACDAGRRHVEERGIAFGPGYDADEDDEPPEGEV